MCKWNDEIFQFHIFVIPELKTENLQRDQGQKYMSNFAGKVKVFEDFHLSLSNFYTNRLTISSSSTAN